MAEFGPIGEKYSYCIFKIFAQFLFYIFIPSFPSPWLKPGTKPLVINIKKITPSLSSTLPDTSRAKGESEIDGQDYNFVSRAQFEEYASSSLPSSGCSRFVEHGEYDKQYYGTSLDAVRTVINSGKICVLNLQPSSLKILHESDLKPYVVFLTPPTLQTYRQQKAKYGEQYKVSKS